jgi:predicted nucleic acid-binding protein
MGHEAVHECRWVSRDSSGISLLTYFNQQGLKHWMAKYLIDTCIWRDYYENRTDKFRPLGEWAFEFLKKICIKNEILFPSIIEEEILLTSNQPLVNDIIHYYKAIRIFSSIKQEVEATRIERARNLPFNDALIAVLARDSGAIVISRDHHFEQLRDIVIVKKPEDLL